MGDIAKKTLLRMQSVFIMCSYTLPTLALSNRFKWSTTE